MKTLSFLVVGIIFFLFANVDAAPRMVSYNYPNCISCHVSPQGRGLLTPYGHGVDVAQSLEHYNIQQLLGKSPISENQKTQKITSYQDIRSTFRATYSQNEDDTAFTTNILYRHILGLGKRKQFRINTEVGYSDSDLENIRLGRHYIANGSRKFYLKKLLLEWRITENENGLGREIAVGRDLLPLGLQISDYDTDLLNLNHNGARDYPTQLKYFQWTNDYLFSLYAFAPSFEEVDSAQEYGGGFFYEHYLDSNLAIGVQGLNAFADDADRYRFGFYTRWGLSEKFGLLGSIDYTRFTNIANTKDDADQFTGYLKAHYHHTEWLYSNFTINYAHNNELLAGSNLFSWKYSLSARLTPNATLGISYTEGDQGRNPRSDQRIQFFSSIKF